MRFSMFLSLLTAGFVLVNVIDLFSNDPGFTDDVPSIIVGSVIFIALIIYMFKTPDKNFVPLRKVKNHLPDDLYQDLKKKGPFQ